MASVALASDVGAAQSTAAAAAADVKSDAAAPVAGASAFRIGAEHELLMTYDVNCTADHLIHSTDALDRLVTPHGDPVKLQTLVRTEAAAGNPYAIGVLGVFVLFGWCTRYDDAEECVAHEQRDSQHINAYTATASALPGLRDELQAVAHVEDALAERGLWVGVAQLLARDANPTVAFHNAQRAFPLFELAAAMGSVMSACNLCVCQLYGMLGRDDDFVHFCAAPTHDINDPYMQRRARAHTALQRMSVQYPRHFGVHLALCRVALYGVPPSAMDELPEGGQRVVGVDLNECGRLLRTEPLLSHSDHPRVRLVMAFLYRYGGAGIVQDGAKARDAYSSVLPHGFTTANRQKDSAAEYAARFALLNRARDELDRYYGTHFVQPLAQGGSMCMGLRVLVEGMAYEHDLRGGGLNHVLEPADLSDEDDSALLTPEQLQSVKERNAKRRAEHKVKFVRAPDGMYDDDELCSGSGMIEWYDKRCRMEDDGQDIETYTDAEVRAIERPYEIYWSYVELSLQYGAAWAFATVANATAGQRNSWTMCQEDVGSGGMAHADEEELTDAHRTTHRTFLECQEWRARVPPPRTTRPADAERRERMFAWKRCSAVYGDETGPWNWMLLLSDFDALTQNRALMEPLQVLWCRRAAAAGDCDAVRLMALYHASQPLAYQMRRPGGTQSLPDITSNVDVAGIYPRPVRADASPTTSARERFAQSGCVANNALHWALLQYAAAIQPANERTCWEIGRVHYHGLSHRVGGACDADARVTGAKPSDAKAMADAAADDVTRETIVPRHLLRAVEWWASAGSMGEQALGAWDRDGRAHHIFRATTTYSGGAYYEFAGKFWEISIANTGNVMHTRFGPIGTAGIAQTKAFGDGDAAQQHYDTAVHEKVAKGYVLRPDGPRAERD